MNKKSLLNGFFIRYTDPGHHLRLRIELSNVAQIGKAISDVHEAFSNELESGIVSDIHLASYQRELERYGEDNIENCESFFFKDSIAVLETLKGLPAESLLLTISVDWIISLLSSIGMNHTLIKEFLSEMEHRYQNEFKLSPLQIKSINDNYRNMSAGIVKNVMNICSTPLNIKPEFGWINGEKSTKALLPSLIHMHMNRLFSINQRLYEYIIYHYAYKSFDSALKRV